MGLAHAPIVKQQLLIRRPAQEVFRAFVDPALTTKFWFTKSSGPLEAGKTVRWEWEMYGASTEVRVDAIERDKRIRIEWGGSDRRTIVEWELEARPDGTTLVRVTHSGFAGDDDARVAQALDSMGGFTSLLAGAKAYLEHGIELGLVGDHHPDAHVKR
jgi:uncharacterized protein YndB with AHSA1/START domain